MAAIGWGTPPPKQTRRSLATPLIRKVLGRLDRQGGVDTLPAVRIGWLRSGGVAVVVFTVVVRRAADTNGP